MAWWAVTLITIALIIASAFFVIIEFALLAARRHRLEEDAPRSAAARAALRGMNELTLMLAAAQLGITVCTFLLGAITKPAIYKPLAPVLRDWGLPLWLADAAAFGFALVVVTFLHLVVGEMAPKSWAIAHPETAAKAVGVPSRGFAWPLRPFLLWINHVANRLVSASGVEPVEKAAVGGQDADTIRELVSHSREAGVLESQYSTPIENAIGLGSLTVRDIVRTDKTPTAVGVHATAQDVQEASARSGHLRVLVGVGPDARIVHVRDTLDVPETTPVSEIARDAFVLSPEATVLDTLTTMRREHEQLGIVVDDNSLIGVVSLDDLLREVLPGPADPLVQAVRG